MNFKRFLSYSIVILSVTFLFSSCDTSNTSENLLNGFAPKSIVGKTFLNKIYFKNSSSFSFVKDVEGENTRIIGTPSYTYRKTGDNTADLSYEYTLEHFNNISVIMDYTEIYSVIYHLHFTSAEAG